MALQRHSIRSFECSSATKTADTDCALPYLKHSPLRLDILLPLRHTAILALTHPVYDLLHGIESFNIGNAEPSFRFPTRSTFLVTLCFLFPCSVASDSGARAYQKIYLWISSSWHYFSWCFCSLWNGSPGFLAVVSRNQKYTAHPRLEFQNSYL